jgi:hypothetical protein
MYVYTRAQVVHGFFGFHQFKDFQFDVPHVNFFGATLSKTGYVRTPNGMRLDRVS